MRTFLASGIAVGLICMSPAAPVASAADLSVTVEGIRAGTGSIIFALHDAEDRWPEGKAAYNASVPAAVGHVVYVFRNLPPGRYALTGFDDENGNGKMDYSLLGLPEEGFLFSNDQSPGLSAPSFDSCAFAIGADPVAITVHIQHWGDRGKREH